MALKDIAQKIVDDAKIEAQKIASETNAEVATIKSSSEKEAQKVVADTVAKMERKIGLMESRVNTLGESEGKNLLLSKKRELMNEAFEGAKKYLASMPKNKKDEIIISFFTSLKEGDGVVYPAKNSTEEIKLAMKKAGKSFQIGEEEDFLAGFVFEGESTLIDFSFDSIVDKEIRTEMETEIPNILFS